MARCFQFLFEIDARKLCQFSNTPYPCVLIKFKSTYESCDPKILLQKKAVGLLKLKLYFISLVDQLSRW